MIIDSFEELLAATRRKYPALPKNFRPLRRAGDDRDVRWVKWILRDALTLIRIAEDAGEWGATAAIYEWIDVVLMNKPRPTAFLNAAVDRYLVAGDLAEAYRCAALALTKAVNFPAARVRALAGYSTVLGAMGDLDGALYSLKQAEELLETSDDDELRADADSLIKEVDDARTKLCQ